MKIRLRLIDCFGVSNKEGIVHVDWIKEDFNKNYLRIVEHPHGKNHLFYPFMLFFQKLNMNFIVNNNHNCVFDSS